MSNEAKLSQFFRAVSAEVKRAHGGVVRAEIKCGPQGEVLNWHVEPAWVTAESLPLQFDVETGTGAKSA